MVEAAQAGSAPTAAAAPPQQQAAGAPTAQPPARHPSSGPDASSLPKSPFDMLASEGPTLRAGANGRATRPTKSALKGQAAAAVADDRAVSWPGDHAIHEVREYEPSEEHDGRHGGGGLCSGCCLQ
eukprot:scaffold19.g1844.t1